MISPALHKIAGQVSALASHSDDEPGVLPAQLHALAFDLRVLATRLEAQAEIMGKGIGE